MNTNRASSLHLRRGFTLVELVIAGVITAFVLGSMSMSLTQLSRAKSTSRMRLDAHLRADTALAEIRRDIASILRSDDLFFTRFLLFDDVIRVGDEVFDRDEMLAFNSRLRPLRSIEFNGEGFEYETQYRVTDDDHGPVLWQRRDAFPDEYPLAGGTATPLVEGVIGLSIQAYDGESWYDTWDSDLLGLPLAVSVTVYASGHRNSADVYAAPRALLRTIISIDRVISPKDLFKIEEDDDAATDLIPESEETDADTPQDTAAQPVAPDQKPRRGTRDDRPGDRLGPGGRDPRQPGARPARPGVQPTRPKRPVHTVPPE